MTDGVRVVRNEYVDRLHSKRGTAGRLYKGMYNNQQFAFLCSSFGLECSTDAWSLVRHARYFYTVHMVNVM
jgi:hypothetical protein